MKEAQNTYMLPSDQPGTTSMGSPLHPSNTPATGELSRRYKTSANDREKRASARSSKSRKVCCH